MATAAQYVGVGHLLQRQRGRRRRASTRTAHTGIKFDISGTIGGTGCTAQFSTNDSAHSDATANPTDKKAGGPAGAYAPQASLTVSATATTVMMPFTCTGRRRAAARPRAIDKAKLTGVQWQFTVAAGATNACMVDIIDRQRDFY